MAQKTKHLPLLASILSFILLLSTACSKDHAAENEENVSKVKKEEVVVDIFQGKVEITDQLKKLTDKYTQEHPSVKFNIQTVGGGGDYTAVLKAQFASGNEPDIFHNGGYEEAQVWKKRLEDLSDQPWIKDAYEGALEPITMDGKVYGQPLNLEGYGFIYNKDLFKKAGILTIPKTLSQLEDVSRRLKETGITPFSIGYGEWWVLSVHLLNVPFAHQENPSAFIESLNEGSVKIAANPKFQEFMDLFDLTIKYGNQNPLSTDYHSQVTQFASGETAMMQQGNWVQPMIDKINPDMNVGLLPMPINNNAAENDKLFVGVSTNWVINKNAPGADKKAAKDFLNWMVSSQTGKKALVEDFQFIPAFKTIGTKGTGPLGEEVMRYLADGKILSWNWYKYPGGVLREFGASMQSYAGGQTSKEEFLNSLDSIWAKSREQ